MAVERTAQEVFIGRQPILTDRKDLFAYELLYRSSMENAFDGTDSTTATARLIANSCLNIGLERLVGQRRAFINFDRHMLLDGFPGVLPSQTVVVEILEHVEPDEDVVAACVNLKKRGYLLALDDFVCAEGYERLLEFADIVKVDFRLASLEQTEKVARELGGRRLRLLAEKVETHEEFQRAMDFGYQLFQGYFFSRPMIVEGRKIPGFKLNYLRILKEISNPELDFTRIEEVVKREASLVHQLLRYVNSANFGWSHTVESIRHALALLGEQEVRKWISLATLSGLGLDKPLELVIDTVMRGRLCESLSRHIGLSERSSEMFLLGMYSLLDALLDRPMAEVLAEVHLADDVRDALLETASAKPQLAGPLRIAKLYESGDWEALKTTTESLGLKRTAVAESCLEAAEWTDQVFRDGR